MKASYTINKPLWESQQVGMQRALASGQVFNMEMGTGKTLTTLAVAREIGACRILNLCPKVALGVWPNEVAKHIDGPLEAISLTGSALIQKRTIEGLNAIRRCELRGIPYLLSVNYEAFWREPLWTALSGFEWDLIICDESHKIKANTARQSKAVNVLENHRRRYKRALPLALSGTFLGHSMLDAFGQMRFVAPEVFGSSYFLFERHYAIKGGFEQKQVIGYQNVEEFQQRLAPWVYTIKCADVQELPPVEDVPILFDLTGKNLTVYRSMEKDFMADIEGGTVTAKNGMVKVLRLQQITGGSLPVEHNATRIGDDKRNALDELLEQIPEHEPVVIFTRFTADLYACVTALMCRFQGGRDDISIVGDGMHEEQDFEQGKTRGIVLNIKAGGMSIDLTRARYVIYYSVDPSLTAYLQSRKRAHRPGQERPVINYHLVARGTIDARVYRALSRREEVLDSIVEGIRKREEA